MSCVLSLNVDNRPLTALFGVHQIWWLVHVWPVPAHRLPARAILHLLSKAGGSNVGVRIRFGQSFTLFLSSVGIFVLPFFDL